MLSKCILPGVRELFSGSRQGPVGEMVVYGLL
jgi:hypothetical protein